MSSLEGIKINPPLPEWARCIVCSGKGDRDKTVFCLPCCHILCDEDTCHQRVFTDGGGTCGKCPSCKKTVDLGSTNKIKLVDILPGMDSGSKAVAVDGGGGSKNGKTRKERVCQICIYKHPAVGYCQQCRQFLCNDCNENHPYLKPFASHTVTTDVASLEGIDEEDEETEELTKRLTCDTHVDKEAVGFCRKCDSALCTNCYSLDSQDGSSCSSGGGKHSVCSLKEAVSTLQDLLQSQKKVTDTIKKTVRTKASKVKEKIAYLQGQCVEDLHKETAVVFETIMEKVYARSNQLNSDIVDKIKYASGALKSKDVELSNFGKNLKQYEQMMQAILDKCHHTEQGQVLNSAEVFKGYKIVRKYFKNETLKAKELTSDPYFDDDTQQLLWVKIDHDVLNKIEQCIPQLVEVLDAVKPDPDIEQVLMEVFGDVDIPVPTPTPGKELSPSKVADKPTPQPEVSPARPERLSFFDLPTPPITPIPTPSPPPPSTAAAAAKAPPTPPTMIRGSPRRAPQQVFPVTSPRGGKPTTAVMTQLLRPQLRSPVRPAQPARLMNPSRTTIRVSTAATVNLSPLPKPVLNNSSPPPMIPNPRYRLASPHRNPSVQIPLPLLSMAPPRPPPLVRPVYSPHTANGSQHQQRRQSWDNNSPPRPSLARRLNIAVKRTGGGFSPRCPSHNNINQPTTVRTPPEPIKRTRSTDFDKHFDLEIEPVLVEEDIIPQPNKKIRRRHHPHPVQPKPTPVVEMDSETHDIEIDTDEGRMKLLEYTKEKPKLTSQSVDPRQRRRQSTDSSSSASTSSSSVSTKAVVGDKIDESIISAPADSTTPPESGEPSPAMITKELEEVEQTLGQLAAEYQDDTPVVISKEAAAAAASTVTESLVEEEEGTPVVEKEEQRPTPVEVQVPEGMSERNPPTVIEGIPARRLRSRGSSSSSSVITTRQRSLTPVLRSSQSPLRSSSRLDSPIRKEVVVAVKSSPPKLTVVEGGRKKNPRKPELGLIQRDDEDILFEGDDEAEAGGKEEKKKVHRKSRQHRRRRDSGGATDEDEDDDDDDDDGVFLKAPTRPEGKRQVKVIRPLDYSSLIQTGTPSPPGPGRKKKKKNPEDGSPKSTTTSVDGSVDGKEIKSHRKRGRKRKLRPSLDPMKTTADSDHDDYCCMCRDGGDKLICCDMCPKIFHPQCHIPALSGIPEGDFFCNFCKSPGDSMNPEKQQDNHIRNPARGGLHSKPIEFYKACKFLAEIFDVDYAWHFRVRMFGLKSEHMEKMSPLFRIKEKLTKSQPSGYKDAGEIITDLDRLFKQCEDEVKLSAKKKATWTDDMKFLNDFHKQVTFKVRHYYPELLASKWGRRLGGGDTTTVGRPSASTSTTSAGTSAAGTSAATAATSAVGGSGPASSGS